MVQGSKAMNKIVAKIQRNDNTPVEHYGHALSDQVACVTCLVGLRF